MMEPPKRIHEQRLTVPEGMGIDYLLSEVRDYFEKYREYGVNATYELAAPDALTKIILSVTNPPEDKHKLIPSKDIQCRASNGTCDALKAEIERLF